MTEKTLPPSKSGDSSRAARGLKDGPPIDQNSQTLINFPAVVPPGSAPSTVAHGPGETLQAPPPSAEPPPVPKDETNADKLSAGLTTPPELCAGLPTPHTPDPPAPPESPPGPAGVGTMEFVRPNPSDLTVSGAPDLTLGGNEAVKEPSLHFDKAAQPDTSAGSNPGALPRVQDPGTREYRLADFVRDNPDATLGGHDSATRAFHLAAFTAPTHDATLGGHDAVTQQFHQEALAGAPKAITKGASFGHYELIEPIAKGGMGIVYKARQRTLNRIVAIKMILAGQFADQSDIDRFYAEAEAAAALSHPNIVAIHEIGQVQGQHFFSMDYIEGKSLSALIQENPVPPRRAAEFVRTIAETMQFAHDSGVVHRDLKPANILLDKRQRPLITDFGLAKQVSNTSQLTMAGSVVGTPSYMPPEQAAGKIDEVGPWSDLYSLGAILYELLTGRPPFRAATPFETVRQVLEQEPPSPRLLNPALPRDLETIALKCLQKERTRRYDSAQELADELGRYLRGEPIHARPISQIHRFWRLCKRNPITSSAIALAAVFFIAASIVSTVAYFRTAAALAKWETGSREQSEVIDNLLTKVGEEKLANLPGGQPIQKEILDDARAYNERFLKQRANDPSVANEVARSYFRVGKISMTLGRYEEALDPFLSARLMQEQLLAKQPNDEKRLKVLSDTLTELGQIYYRKTDFNTAGAVFAEAANIRRRLASAVPGNTEYQRLRASSHMNAGLASYAVAQMNQNEEKKFKDSVREARKQYEDAQEVRLLLVQREPGNLKVRRDLGKGYFNLGNLADLELNKKEAVQHYRDAANVFEDVLKDDPKDLDNQGLLTNCYRLVGALSKDQPAEARKSYDDALARLDTLVKQNPEVPEYQSQQAGLLLNMSQLEKDEKNEGAARDRLERARRIYETLTKKFPDVHEYQKDLALTLEELAFTSDLKDAGQTSAALANLNESLRIVRGLVAQYGPDYRTMEANTLRKLATKEQDSGDHASALEHFGQEVAIIRKLAEEIPDATHKYELALSLLDFVQARHAAGDKEADKTLQEAIQQLSALAKEFPEDARYDARLKEAQAVDLTKPPK